MTSPPGRRSGPPTPGKAATADTTSPNKFNRAWRRQTFLDCGCSWPCRCNHKTHPTDRRVAGYRDAIAHLDAAGLTAAPLLPELRRLWRAGDRQLVAAVTTRWELRTDA